MWGPLATAAVVLGDAGGTPPSSPLPPSASTLAEWGPVVVAAIAAIGAVVVALINIHSRAQGTALTPPPPPAPDPAVTQIAIRVAVIEARSADNRRAARNTSIETRELRAEVRELRARMDTHLDTRTPPRGAPIVPPSP